MAQRMFLSLKSLSTIAFIIELNCILYAYSKDCWILRGKRDKIILSVNRTSCMPNNNPCSEFGSILELTDIGCTCICPSRQPTYMDTTNKCAAYEDVWSECNLSFRRQLSAIPIFSSQYSTSLRINIPKKFKQCKMVADEKNSYYLSGKGWSKLPQKYTNEFPFLVSTKIVKKRLLLTYLKWKTQVPIELVGKVFRLGIICGQLKDCVTFKISGKAFGQCILPPTTMLPVTPSPSLSIPLSSTDRPIKHYSTLHAPFTRKNNITTEQHNPSRPSPSKKKTRESSSMLISWSIIGTVIGVIIALLLCIVIMAVCFWRRKNFLQKNQNSNAATQSSRGTSSSSEIQPEVTYASPHHPYQQLKPPTSGTPRGTYQSLKWNRKDSSGYLLPSVSSATNNSDPLYNEIGSPKSTLPLVYDYALPEDTVRFNKHLSGTCFDCKMNDVKQNNTGNGLDYVGRTSVDQEEPKIPETEDSVSMPPNVDPMSPGYLDFNSEEPSEYRSTDSKVPIGAKRSSKYKNHGNAPKSPFKKSTNQEHAYQVLESPGAPVYQKISLENLDDKRGNDSTA